MNGKRDERIRSRAYGMWEREGRPQGRHEHHWHQAVREVDGESSETGSEQPHSNADARLSGNEAPASPAAPPASAPVGKAAAQAKRPAAPKARAKASAKPKT
jgi:hypothetical protein